MKKLLTILVAVGIVSIANNSFAARSSSNNVILNPTSVLTRLTPTADIVVTASDIALAREGTSFSAPIAYGCAYTNHAEGDMDQTLTADTNHSSDGELAIYNAVHGKIVVNLEVTSSNDAAAKTFSLGSPLQLQSHADMNSTLSGCPNNENTYTLIIPAANLAAAKAGTYTAQFTITGSAYSG